MNVTYIIEIYATLYVCQGGVTFYIPGTFWLPAVHLQHTQKANSGYLIQSEQVGAALILCK